MQIFNQFVNANWNASLVDFVSHIIFSFFYGGEKNPFEGWKSILQSIMDWNNSSNTTALPFENGNVSKFRPY